VGVAAVGGGGTAGIVVPGVELAEEIGRGAGTAVYRAVREGREYAVKILRSPGDDRPAVRFRREAALLASLHHPGLARVHDVGEVGGRPYLIMDLIDGRTLTQVLREESLDEARVLAMAGEVADALTVAHRAGLVHRDIKPDNIMVTRDGGVRVIDLGLAGRTVDAVADAAVGTFLYSAPEQTGALRRAVDGRADLYALGVVMFECLTGAPPFRAADVGALIHMHLAATPPDPRHVRPDLAPALAQVVGKLLAKDPDDRYQSARGLRADLARIAAGERDGFPLDTGDGGADSDLVGQDDLVHTLVQRWRRTVGGHGGLVMLEGPAGSGKSRLAREVAAAASAAGRLVLHGKSGVDDAVPLAPLRDAVERHTRRIRALNPDDRAAAVERLRAAAGATAPLLRTLSPTLAGLLDVGETMAGHDERQFADAVATLLVGLAQQAGGAILHLDDVQWWDEGTRRVVRQLAPMLAGSRLLVVATARDDADSAPAVRAVLEDLGLAVDARLAVRPLDDAAIESLVHHQLGGGRVPKSLVAQLSRRGDGNPLAVREFIRAIVDAGLLRPSWGTWRLDSAGLDALALPDDIADLVVRRVDALGRATRDLLTVAAVVGARFDADLIGALAGEPDHALTALAEAAGHRLIEPTASGGYAFLHDRIREALLADLCDDARRELHQRIAEALKHMAAGTPERIYAMARHYLRGDLRRTPEMALRAATAAGELALAEHAPVDAVDFLARAGEVAAAAGITPDAAFHATFGVALIYSGQYVAGEDQLHRALTTERNPRRRARYYCDLAVSHHLRWEGNRAVEMIQRGLAELGHPLPRHPVAYWAKTFLFFGAGLVVGALPRRLRRVDGPARETCTLRAELLNIGAQCAAIAMRLSLMGSFNLYGLLLANRLADGRQYGDNRAGLSMLTGVMGLWRLSDRLYDRAVAEARATGDPRYMAHVGWMGGVRADVGLPTNAITGQALRQSLEEHARALDTGEYLTGIGTLAHLQILRGYRADVVDWYRRGVARAGMSPEMLGNVFATVGAQAAALAGQAAEAAAQLGVVRDFVANLSDNRAQIVNLAVADIQVALEQGETGTALDRALDSFAALDLRPGLVWSLHRPAWVYQAFGRLAQAAAAPPDSRADRLVQAERAIRALRRAANGPVLRAYHAAAVAALYQIRGEHERALRAIARAQRRSAGLDLPRLEYEVARVQARALRGLDRPADARRRAAEALLLANAHGWATRARWVRTEFGLEPSTAHSVGATVTSDGQRTSATAHVSSGSTGLHGRRLEALHQVSLAASTILDPAQLARVALIELLRIFGAERAFLFLVDADGDRLTPFLGRDSTGTDLDRLTGYGSTLVERVRTDRTALVVTGSEEGAALGSESSLIHGLRSIMVAPLLVKGRLLGVVYLDSRAARGIFTGDDVDILAAITNHVATSLETARAAQLELAVHAAERERDVAESLRATLNDLTSTLDPGEVRERLGARIAAILPGSTVRVLDEADPMLSAVPEGRDVLRGTRAGGEPPVAGLVPADAHAWLALPLRVRGRILGLLVASTPGRDYTGTEVELVAAMAEQGATALDNATLFQRVDELATRDGLTGLFNRRHFYSLAEHRAGLWRRYRWPIAAIMVDVDHFKAINDTHGHAVGDEVIREVADRLRHTLRDTDLICRYGGEEFAVLLPETTAEASRTAAERMHKAVIGAPMPTAAGDLLVTVSVGLAGPAAMDGDVATLLDHADRALYQAKRAGRNRVTLIEA
jgi:diguanylate cyclase (GGDEF)-like protein